MFSNHPVVRKLVKHRSITKCLYMRIYPCICFSLYSLLLMRRGKESGVQPEASVNKMIDGFHICKKSITGPSIISQKQSLIFKIAACYIYATRGRVMAIICAMSWWSFVKKLFIKLLSNETQVNRRTLLFI